MKKVLSLILSISLICGLSAASMSAPAKKAVVKKAVKQVVKPAPKKVAPAPKKVTPAPAPAAPWIPPAPQPVAPSPVVPSPVVKAAPGMGVTTGVKAGLSAGLTGIAGDLDYSIASIIPDTSLRITGSYVSGTNPTGNDSVKAVNLGVGAKYALTMLKSSDMPVDLYVGGSVLLPVKVSLGQTGKWGAEAFVGGSYMVPDLGTLYAEVGYAGLKYSGTKAALKGISASVGYNYAF